jgi:SAM-dependent methyltransferase
MWPYSKRKYYARQKKIRALEWNSIEEELKKHPGNFLDIGCGIGCALSRAQKLGFSVVGIEPNLRRVEEFSDQRQSILRGVSEYLPFKDAKFDTIFSSHSLEHFKDRNVGLKEILRVLKPNGIIIIIVPTGTMAFVNLISQILFTTHVRIGRFVLKERSFSGIKQIFIPGAHGSYDHSVIGEINGFSIKKWRLLISRYFVINRTILPGLYPYPDFPPLFPFIKSDKFSSSVVFVCSKK